ncbi:hypothetical protein WMY93_031094 [Mugilogobius chulae]|uniref:Ig-like domain-containing protein n=1 Tax=Mugilogobius chulae TaxID=88201 RepID=A0AAW0MGF4_9GOBI
MLHFSLNAYDYPEIMDVRCAEHGAECLICKLDKNTLDSIKVLKPYEVKTFLDSYKLKFTQEQINVHMAHASCGLDENSVEVIRNMALDLITKSYSIANQASLQVMNSVTTHMGKTYLLMDRHAAKVHNDAVKQFLGLASTCQTLEILVTTTERDVNATLKCVTKKKPGVQYSAVRWYKESADPRLTGLVSRGLPNGTMRWYVGADTRISLQKDTLNLQLPKVTCSDQGVYQCYLAAPVGEQNREGRVRLDVISCPTVKSPEPKKHMEKAEKNVDNILLEDENTTFFLVTCGAVGVMCAFSVLIITFLCCECLRNSLWTQAKTHGKDPYLEPILSREKVIYPRTIL